MKYLFIGGCADGEWLDVESGRPRWSVAGPPSTPPVTYQEPVNCDSVPMKVHDYDRHVFRFVQGDLTIYAKVGMTACSALKRLMATYSPTAE